MKWKIYVLKHFWRDGHILCTIIKRALANRVILTTVNVSIFWALILFLIKSWSHGCWKWMSCRVLMTIQKLINVSKLAWLRTLFDSWILRKARNIGFYRKTWIKMLFNEINCSKWRKKKWLLLNKKKSKYKMTSRKSMKDIKWKIWVDLKNFFPLKLLKLTTIWKTKANYSIWNAKRCSKKSSKSSTKTSKSMPITYLKTSSV